MICFFNYSIGHYHAARFKHLNKNIGDEILFIEISSSQEAYPWKSSAKEINAVTLFPNIKQRNIGGLSQIRAVNKLLNQIRPKAVISVSYSSPAMRAASLWAKRNNAISICANDTWKGSKRRIFLKEAVKSILIRNLYDGLFLSGFRSSDYYQGLGYPSSKIWTGYDCVDNDFYIKMTEEAKSNQENLRREFSLPKKYFLCVARLIEEKNLHRLIHAFKLYRELGGNWDLVITGSGPLETVLKKLVADKGLNSHIQFPGWRDQNDMAIFYGLASCFILPSISETWGLAVNEAMASSLPILLSEVCGCAPDLCMKGVNGYTFDPYNENEMADAFFRISMRDVDLEGMGMNSRQMVERYSLTNFANSLQDCISTLMVKNE